MSKSTTLPRSKRKGPVEVRSSKKSPIDSVTAALAAQWRAQRKTTTMMEERPTTKLDTHRAPKLTFNTKSSYGMETLRACPGGKGIIGIIRMIAAEETGCRLAEPAELARLQYSARNANTTQLH